MPLSNLIGRTFEAKPPSKINLRLKIEGRRPDGYHLLSMLNITTKLCDELSLKFEEGSGVELDVISSNELAGSDVSKNSVVIAIEEFLNVFQIPIKAHATLKKNIPIGSGLGGGSSDAASTLNILKDCFLTRIVEVSKKKTDEIDLEIAKIALKIGADVPFFLRSHFARVTGIGEKIERYDSKFLADHPCVLVVPKVRNNTKAVYEAFRKKHPVVTQIRDMVGERYGEALRLNTAMEGYEPFPSRTIKASLWRQLVSQMSNDLENIVCEFSPQVQTALTALRSVPDTVSGITGSGSALFVFGKSLDYFEKNGIGALKTSLVGLDTTIFETQVLAA